MPFARVGLAAGRARQRHALLTFGRHHRFVCSCRHGRAACGTLGYPLCDVAVAGRVVAVTDLDNHASQRVARRIGMHHVGRARVDDDQELEFFVS